MTAIRGVRPRSMGTDTQSLLQHFYFIALVAIVFAFVILRIIVLRRRNQTLSDFFRGGDTSQLAYDSQPQNDSNYGSLFHGLQLVRPPAVYQPQHRVHAADIDRHGRRLDLAGESWDGKDALPAYDNVDRPPKYVEAGWTHGEPPVSTEPSAVTPSPVGEQSGTTHSATADAPPVDGTNRPLSHSHAMEGGVLGSVALPPPTHHDSTGS